MLNRLLLAACVAGLLACSPAFADDWIVIKLRGGVEQQIDGNWAELKRGDVVSVDRLIRTLADGHVDLQRDKEVVTLGASTQIRIHDQAGERFTTVEQSSGSVEVDAEIRNVQHFSVETPYLAAVVKGTHFVVTAEPTGGSVTVTRGFVAVVSKASQHSTTVTVGQTASVDPQSDLTVAGSGTLPAIIGADGQPVAALSSGGTAGPDGNSGTAAALPAAAAGGGPGDGSGPGGGSAGGGSGSNPGGEAGGGGSTGGSGASTNSTRVAEAKLPNFGWEAHTPEMSAPGFSIKDSTTAGLVMGGIGILLGVLAGGLAVLFKKILS
jgi:hypothetical protein